MKYRVATLKIYTANTKPAGDPAKLFIHIVFLHKESPSRPYVVTCLVILYG